MTSIPRWDAPELGMRAIRMVVLYFERTLGRPRLEQVFAESKLPLPLSHLEDDQNYVSLAFAERLLEALVAASGDPRFMEKASRWAATPEALGFPYYLLRSLGTPSLLYRKVLELGPTYNRVGRFELRAETPNSLELAYTSSVPEKSRNFCLGRQGTFASFPTIWGLPEAEVKELECAVQGGSCCRYQLTWVRPVSNWRRWAGLGAGLAAGLVSAAVVGHGAPAIALWALAGLLFGALLDSRAARVRQDVYLEEQRRGLERSLVELEQRAQELHRANLELDQRVATRTRELDDALRRLRELDQLKNSFFANLSHELRTPLTLILAPLEQLLASEAAPARARSLELVQGNARLLLRLIDDLLDLSRIDAGNLKLSLSPIDPAALVRNLSRALAPAIEATGAEFVLTAPPSIDGCVGDVARLELALTTLLTNALGVVHEGRRVAVSVEDGAGAVAISIADDGPHLSPPELAELFQRFTQVGEGRRRGGEGIGLALARQLVDLHGGALEAKSAPGQGLRFELTLKKGEGHVHPEHVERRQVQVEMAGRRAADRAHASIFAARSGGAAPLAAEAQEAEAGLQSRRARVLVAEDNPNILALLEEILASEAEVLTASDGLAALKAVERDRPDLVITDDMMPGLRGTELCARIKASPELKSTPVLILTARRGAEAALDSYSHGADEFIEKPFHAKVLLARVRAQLRLRAQALQLAAQMRLAGVGLLAAGVGHEIRNPVNVVINGARLLTESPDLEPDKAQRVAQRLFEAGQRIDRISAALLSHASPGDSEGLRPVNLVEGLDSTLELLAHRLGGVQVHKEFADGAMVVGSATQLNQVLLNLVDNALRAPAKNLWLKISQAPEAIAVDIADDGPGVKPETAPHLFAPFFTTRAPGEGTGLGLYLSRQFVRRWGGDLRFAPRPGGGAVFTLELPRERGQEAR